MAHVWVEAYLAGKGWVMIDPSTLAANFLKVGEERERGFGYRLRMYLDSCNYYWTMAVIAYDLEKQFQLVNNINFRMKRISFPVHAGKVLLLGGVPLIFLILVIVAARRKRVSREERILRKFLRLVEKKYSLTILPSTGLQELATLSNDPLIDRFVSIYGGAVYCDRELTSEEYRLLRELLKSIS